MVIKWVYSKLFDLIKLDDNRSLADIVLDTDLDCNLGIALKVEKGKISGLLLHPYVKEYKYGRHKSFFIFLNYIDRMFEVELDIILKGTLSL